MLRRVVVLFAIGACTSSVPADSSCPPWQVICEGDDSADGGKADDQSVRIDWGTAIVVVGHAPAVELVLRDLATIDDDVVGAAIVAGMAAAAAVAAPEAVPEDARLIVSARDSLDPRPFDCARTMFREGWLARSLPTGWEEVDGRIEVTVPGERVPPGAIRVLYNRNCNQTYDDGERCFEPWFLLAHELLHATHGMSGTVLADHPDSSDPMQGGSNHEEALTIGRGAYVGVSPSENAIRRTHDIWERDSHGTLCGPRGDSP